MFAMMYPLAIVCFCLLVEFVDTAINQLSLYDANDQTIMFTLLLALPFREFW